MRRLAPALDLLVLGYLFLFAAVQPVSLAATHIAYASAAFFWIIRLALVPRIPLQSSPLDIPVLVYWVLCALSASFSPMPGLSWEGMRKICLVFLVFVVAQAISNKRHAWHLVVPLLVAGLSSVAFTGWRYFTGIGLQVGAVHSQSLLDRAGIRENDILLRVDGHTFRRPDVFFDYLRVRPAHEPLRILFSRGEDDPKEKILRAFEDARPVTGEDLGAEFVPARRFRATGFYGHWVTYAQELQLLAALAFGLCLSYTLHSAKRAWLWAAAWLAFSAALAATLTRACWLATVLSCTIQLWFHTRRRWVRVALPLVWLVAGVGTDAAMRHWRGVGLIDLRDTSTNYRLLMWQDGLRLIREHPWFGVGMNVIPAKWWEFNLVAYRRYGHQYDFHSTPFQIAANLGLPVLAAWVFLMWSFTRLLIRLVRKAREQTDAPVYGLALGIFGGTAGFLASSLVHNNFGDSEVVFLLWFLAGIALTLDRQLSDGDLAAVHQV